MMSDASSPRESRPKKERFNTLEERGVGGNHIYELAVLGQV